MIRKTLIASPSLKSCGLIDVFYRQEFIRSLDKPRGNGPVLVRNGKMVLEIMGGKFEVNGVLFSGSGRFPRKVRKRYREFLWSDSSGNTISALIREYCYNAGGKVFVIGCINGVRCFYGRQYKVSLFNFRCNLPYFVKVNKNYEFVWGEHTVDIMSLLLWWWVYQLELV